jgi:tetratricopeptide (TPR) repeat protein
MKRLFVYSIIFFCVIAGLQAQKASYLTRGIVYYLIGDFSQAQAQLNTYFRGSRQVQVKRGFDLLIQQKHEDAVTQFSRYLEINHRSTIALVGISLATADMKDTNSIQNLQRALRLNSGFIPAHLCIGFEYMKTRNYPLAERHLNRSYRFSRVREIKILLSDLYFKMGEPKVVLDLVKKEADASPDNYYFNFLTARAYYELNQMDALRNYVDIALEVNPASKDARLLKAKAQKRSQGGQSTD